MAKSLQYASADTAAGFAAFSAQAGGEKALLWSVLRQRVIGPKPLDEIKCLDFGCGSGWLAHQLAAEFGVAALGYDPSKEMIAHAPKESGAQFTSDWAQAQKAGPFDLAFMVFVVPALADRSGLNGVFRKLRQALSKGAVLVVAGANPDAVFARHAFFQSHAPETSRPDNATPYKTDILSASGDVIVQVEDYFWKSTSIVAAAKAAGLKLSANTRLADPRSGDNSAKFPYRLWEFRAG